MLSPDLAKLYGVQTKRLVEATKRNQRRFPFDFMFQLSKEEFSDLRSQTATSSWGGSRVEPYAFTEQGIAMLSSVLKSDQAIQVNIEIMRTFVRLRQFALEYKDLAKKLETLEKKYDVQFRAVFDAIRKIMLPTTSQKRPIGIRSKGD